MAGDDAKADPYQVSHSAWHALTVAVDHMQCLRSSLVSELTDRSASIRIHTHAQSSLIRGAFENGARAVWMLGPPTRLARVTRRLSLQAKEVRHSARMRELVGQPGPRTVEQRERQLLDLITNAGVQPDDARRALRSPQYSEIVKAAGELTTLGADLAEVVWSGCSSLAHGDISGTLGLLDKEIVERVGDVNHVRITGSVSVHGRVVCGYQQRLRPLQGAIKRAPRPSISESLPRLPPAGHRPANLIAPRRLRG